MIQHYFKVAFRNLWKYKSQTLISVVGLAVGFSCFAMAMLWIRYEMTYDSFHKKADRIYCVSRMDFYTNSMSRDCPPPLAGYLKSTFPEIANSVVLVSARSDFEYEGVRHTANLLKVDSAFLGMFDVRIVEGSMDFLIPGSRNRAVTREKAQQLFGNESPVGKRIREDSAYTICAVVTGLSKHSNYPFDFLESSGMDTKWNRYNVHALVELVDGVNVEALNKKLHEHTILEARPRISNFSLTPLTAVRYEDANMTRNVEFQHIIIFAVAGSLLILCTLFNYLTLFVSRFRIRQKELALRMVYGASVRSLFVMLSTEFIVTLVAALLLGVLFIEMVFTPFCTLSEIKMGLSAIYLESTAYIAAIIVIALSAFLLTLAIFRRRTLNASIRSNKKMFRKTSIVVQLVVSIVFAFCTTIILKQMYYLHNTDLGFSFKNRGSIRVETNFENIKILNDKIKQIPEIEETLIGSRPLLPLSGFTSFSIDSWDGKQEDAKGFPVEMIVASEEYARYYEFQLIEGDFLSETDGDLDVVINESAVKALGWDKAVGKSFGKPFKFKVKGVVKNIYSSSPTIAAKPVLYSHPMKWRGSGMSRAKAESPYILLKYNEGSWKICMEKIKKIIATELPNTVPVFVNAEEEYDKFLKSENILLAILTVISLVCVIVCVFGFVSMVSLTCEERRREIAIRKINGATIKDILDIFFKEHLTLLVVGAVIAFPAGYLIMKRWLEQYVVQTEMSAWVYVSILLALMLAIVICVGGRVYKTSRENPINAINR